MNYQLKLWMPWIFVVVVALIVIVIIVTNSGVGDNQQRCESIRMVYDTRLDACVEGAPVP